MAQKASEQLVDVLIDWHVKHVYGLPGDSIDTTVDALRKQQDQIGILHGFISRLCPQLTNISQRIRMIVANDPLCGQR